MNITKLQGVTVPLPTFEFEGGDINVTIQKHGVTMGFMQRCIQLQDSGQFDLLAAELARIIVKWDLTHTPDPVNHPDLEAPYPITADGLLSDVGLEFINLLVESIVSVTGGNVQSPKASKNGSEVLASTENPAPIIT